MSSNPEIRFICMYTSCLDALLFEADIGPPFQTIPFHETPLSIKRHVLAKTVALDSHAICTNLLVKLV